MTSTMRLPQEPDERFADWVDGRMSVVERRAFEREVARDTELRAALGRYLDTIELVQTHGREERAPIELADRVMAGLDAEQQVAAPPRARWGFWGTLAAAAALMVAAVGLGWDALRRPDVQQRETARYAPPAEDAEVGERVTAAAESESPIDARRQKVEEVQGALNQRAEKEKASDRSVMLLQPGQPGEAAGAAERPADVANEGTRLDAGVRGAAAPVNEAPRPNELHDEATGETKMRKGRESQTRMRLAPPSPDTGRGDERADRFEPDAEEPEPSVAFGASRSGLELEKSDLPAGAAAPGRLASGADVGVLVVVAEWPAAPARGAAPRSSGQAPLPWQGALAPDAPDVTVREVVPPPPSATNDAKDGYAEDRDAAAKAKAEAVTLVPGDRLFAITAPADALSDWVGALGRGVRERGGSVRLHRTAPADRLGLILRSLVPAEPADRPATAGGDESGAEKTPAESAPASTAPTAEPETVLLIVRSR